MKANLPFGALRTFESVARLRGFGRAAEELDVTQSAVSQHVKSLEEWLGRRVLTRNGTGAVPTADGARLAQAVAENFGRVVELCHDLRGDTGADLTITLSCLPGFAVNWLFPRLLHFDEAHPEFPVSIYTSAQLTNFIHDDSDIAIRYGIGGYSGLHEEKLLGERIFPVCAPALLDRGPPLETHTDLARHTMLVDEVAEVGTAAPPTWEYWAAGVGIPLPHPARARRFSQSNMVVQAAVRGFGVALGREPLVIDALSQGALLRPFPEMVTSQYAYWLVCPPGALKSRRVRAIRDWLHAEIASQPDVTDASLAPTQG